jgi:hypothetical protein
MKKPSEINGKLVRLNLTGEIIEVLADDSTEITVKYLGENITLYPHEVSALTAKEVATYRMGSKRA